jgi:hypothetical protein
VGTRMFFELGDMWGPECLLNWRICGNQNVFLNWRICGDEYAC